jgi:O-glycosyl hydrolase
VELIKVVGRRFEREGIATRLFMPEQVFTQTHSMHRYIDALNGDPAAERYCDIVAVHGYDAKGVGEARPAFPAWTAMWGRAQRGGAPKEMWMTETYPRYRDWGSAFAYALYLYGSLEHGNVGLWTSWGIEGQLINRGRPNAAFYVFSQFARAIRPGARRVTSAASDPGVLATSYVNDAAHGGGVVSVLVNNSDQARAVRLAVSGREAPASWVATRTDRVRRREEAGEVPADGIILLPPRSVTTAVGR